LFFSPSPSLLFLFFFVEEQHKTKTAPVCVYFSVEVPVLRKGVGKFIDDRLRIRRELAHCSPTSSKVQTAITNNPIERAFEHYIAPQFSTTGEVKKKPD
jgi:hypothetical protein